MRFSVFAFSLLFAAISHAAPAAQPDEMGKFMAERGLMARIGDVGGKVSTKTSELVVNAMAFLGAPYKWGGSNFETGFDCSGFVKAIYEQTAGLVLPRRAEQQATSGQKIDAAELQPGDLVFFNTMRRAFSHVGIYVGGGKFIHAPKPGAEVRIESMGVAYWTSRFDGARRVAIDHQPLVASAP